MSSNVTETRPTARDKEIHGWLANVVGVDYRLEPASSDASFRRYLRVRENASTYILMDAPPEYEDSGPFVHVQALLRGAGVNVPEIIETDLDRGLLLLTDLGHCSYLDALDNRNCESLYADALSTLARMQTRVPANAVPDYDRTKLKLELELFPEWFLHQHLGVRISEHLHRTLQDCFDGLIAQCLEQPQVFVHRDYHSRNLMLVESGNPGVLDFQDAVCGPITYDLVSLLRDVYIAWPTARVDTWIREYLDRSRRDSDALENVDSLEFMRWFNLTGVQRHIKIAGIFCRLWYRDNKPDYLRDIPLTLRYLAEVGGRYAETRALADALQSLDVNSRLDIANSEVFAAGGK